MKGWWDENQTEAAIVYDIVYDSKAINLLLFIVYFLIFF
jgi:hypothetical protein